MANQKQNKLYFTKILSQTNFRFVRFEICSTQHRVSHEVKLLNDALDDTVW